jgi:lipid-binding SYLF domain-containing protein
MFETEGRRVGRRPFSCLGPPILTTACLALIVTGLFGAGLANGVSAVSSGAVPSRVKDKYSERAEEAALVLDEVMATPESGIPEWLLEEAHCLAVIPHVVKVGFVFGGRHGRGLVSCRVDGGWSRPSFLSITGGSFGLQIGAQATDFILVFANRRAAERLTENKFTLGGDASVAAGPVGRTASAGTDVKLQTEIYSYSRSRGLFAGLSLEGSSLATDDNANSTVYGGDPEPEDLLFSVGDIPSGVAPFIESLARNAPGEP